MSLGGVGEIAQVGRGPCFIMCAQAGARIPSLAPERRRSRLILCWTIFCTGSTQISLCCRMLFSSYAFASSWNPSFVLASAHATVVSTLSTKCGKYVFILLFQQSASKGASKCWKESQVSSAPSNWYNLLWCCATTGWLMWMHFKVISFKLYCTAK